MTSNTLSKLTSDVLRMTMLKHMNLKEILKMCTIDKYFHNNVCDDAFWHQYVLYHIQDYVREEIKDKGIYDSWRDFAIWEARYSDQLFEYKKTIYGADVGFEEDEYLDCTFLRNFGPYKKGDTVDLIQVDGDYVFSTANIIKPETDEDDAEYEDGITFELENYNVIECGWWPEFDPRTDLKQGFSDCFMRRDFGPLKKDYSPFTADIDRELFSMELLDEDEDLLVILKPVWKILSPAPSDEK